MHITVLTVGQFCTSYYVTSPSTLLDAFSRFTNIKLHFPALNSKLITHQSPATEFTVL